MTRRHVRAVLALILTAAACTSSPTVPGSDAQAVLLRYDDAPTAAQVQAATRLAEDETLVLRHGHAVRITTTATDERIKALPGVRRIAGLGTQSNPVVSMTVVLTRHTTPDDVVLIQSLGADAVYAASEWGTISAVRLRLERIAELDAVPDVKEIEIYLPGEGPRVG